MKHRVGKIETDPIDWSLTTWDGSLREQLRRWSELPLERIVLAQEEMQNLADHFIEGPRTVFGFNPPEEPLLEALTTSGHVGILSNMQARLLLALCIALTEKSFAEMVLWELPAPLPGSSHGYKYRLAYVVEGECALRFDNETGKGDHRHVKDVESRYAFRGPERLVADFFAEIARWNDENSGS